MCNEVARSENRRSRGSGAVVFRDKVGGLSVCNEVARSENRRSRGSGAVVFRDKAN